MDMTKADAFAANAERLMRTGDPAIGVGHAILSLFHLMRAEAEPLITVVDPTSDMVTCVIVEGQRHTWVCEPAVCRPGASARVLSPPSDRDVRVTRWRLEAIEWVQPYSNAVETCPACENTKASGHAPECWIRATLGKPEPGYEPKGPTFPPER